MPAYDVAVIGAGPAGSAASRLLASWGHRVLLLHRPAVAGAVPAESIPPSCRKLFAAAGVLESIDAAGFYRSTGNTVWWGADAEPRREPFSSGDLGYQVHRGAFDRLLREQAAAAGAELREQAVREARLADGGATIVLESRVDVTARFVLDCSGRSGVVARRGWRETLPSHPQTVALVGVWTNHEGWPGVDPTHTLVESYHDGWAWSVPLSERLRVATVMVDPRRTDLARGQPALGVYRRELGKARHLAALLEHGLLESGPSGCDASTYAARTYAEAPALLVGDAGSFIDPLSSYGVKKALASAWLAAVAVHTSLRHPAMTGAALDYFAAREAEMAASLVTQARAQFDRAALGHASAFWADRAVAPDLAAPPEPDVRELREDDRVRGAFDALKARSSVSLRSGACLRVEPRPLVRGHEVVLEDRLLVPALPGGLRYLRDVDTAGLLALAPAHNDVPALFAAYNRRFPPVALPDFLGALSVMLAFGVLELADSDR